MSTPRRGAAQAGRTSISGSDPVAGPPGARTGAAAVRSRISHHEEVTMAKKARRKKARKKSSANHGKRPNS
ncbi:hypothetical protein [Micromonospora sp. WMMD812]|uniref:50S ribosomal protein bL37 n=1 Tax=Micromonospora sp. WMMD812 TaxID=3015152 RepID=UPI00248BD2E0|nr:hypothetical protein [Micromonospora sp. WMMD812]WBB66613.1 hypothetical protein O7603_26235 [Micromonospora sp. WMMD812]